MKLRGCAGGKVNKYMLYLNDSKVQPSLY